MVAARGMYTPDGVSGPRAISRDSQSGGSIVQDEKFPVLNFQDFISADGSVLTTDSRKVAAVFGKRHDHILRSIRKLLADLPAEHRVPNFDPSGACPKR